MKRILSLGVRDPLVRIIVWVGGAGCCSVATFAAGAVGLFTAIVVLGALLTARLRA